MSAYNTTVSASTDGLYTWSNGNSLTFLRFSRILISHTFVCQLVVMLSRYHQDCKSAFRANKSKSRIARNTPHLMKVQCSYYRIDNTLQFLEQQYVMTIPARMIPGSQGPLKIRRPITAKLGRSIPSPSLKCLVPDSKVRPGAASRLKSSRLPQFL
jgi:hypothetical protein